MATVRWVPVVGHVAHDAGDDADWQPSLKMLSHVDGGIFAEMRCTDTSLDRFCGQVERGSALKITSFRKELLNIRNIAVRNVIEDVLRARARRPHHRLQKRSPWR